MGATLPVGVRRVLLAPEHEGETHDRAAEHEHLPATDASAATPPEGAELVSLLAVQPDALTLVEGSAHASTGEHAVATLPAALRREQGQPRATLLAARPEAVLDRLFVDPEADFLSVPLGDARMVWF
jgi:hypothetical protein